MLQILLPAWTVCLDLFLRQSLTASAAFEFLFELPVSSAERVLVVSWQQWSWQSGRGCFCLHRSASWLVSCYWQLWGEQCY